ncbi:MAG: hypothetical protein ACJAZD_003069, partial [Ilumatobacter sp.]
DTEPLGGLQRSCWAGDVQRLCQHAKSAQSENGRTKNASG